MYNKSTPISLLIKLSLAFFLLFGLILKATAQVKIGDNPTIIDPSAILETESSSKGILPPRMTQTQRNGINSPANGLTIFNTSTNNLEVNVGSPASPVWVSATSTSLSLDSLINGTPSGFTGTAGIIYTDTAVGSPTFANQWLWDGTSFISYTPSNATAFYNQGGVSDAGGNKNSAIYRGGAMGIGSDDTPEPSAQLDVNSTTKGFLPPRVTKAQRDAIYNPADGLMVYCINCNPKGYYNYDTTASVTANTPGWVSIGSSSLPDATFTSATINCGGALSGTYQQGLPTTTSNTKLITITAVSGGKYTATTNTQNGVTFSATGTLLSTGAGTQILLIATGTPINGGTFTYTVSLAGQTCTFNVTFAAPAIYNCNATIVSFLSPYTDVLTNGQAYTATVKVPYTAGNGSSYGATTLTQNGLTLTRVAGTYASGGGNIVYNLSGSYSGSTGPNAVIFNLPEGCRVQFNGLQYSMVANAGTDVYFDNLKVRVPSSGNRSLQVGTYTSTMSAEVGSDIFRLCCGNAHKVSANTTLNTTYAYVANWNMPNVGDEQFAFIRNTANNRIYKATLLIGSAYNNNLIRIERVDTTASPSSVKAAIVPAGTAVTLDNISITKPTSGYNTMKISTVSGSISAFWSSARGQSFNGNYEQSGAYQNTTLTTTPVYAEPNWSMNAGDYNQAYIYDNTNQKVYWVQMQTSPGFSNNLIRIERLDNIDLPYRQGKIFSGSTGNLTVNNLKTSVPSTGSRHIQVATLSGNTSAFGSGLAIWNGSYARYENSQTITTTPSYWQNSGWNASSIEDPRLYYIYDQNAGLWYRSLYIRINGSDKLILVWERY